MPFKELPWRLRLLILAKAIAAVATAYWQWSRPLSGQWALLGFLVLCSGIAGACKVDANVRAGRITMGFTVSYFSFLLLGPAEAMLVGLVSVIAARVVQQKQGQQRRVVLANALAYSTLYNGANYVLAAALMGLAYPALGGRYGWVDVRTAAMPCLAAALAYFAVNIGGISLAIAWSQQLRVVDVLRKHFAWALPGFLASASISVGALWAYKTPYIGPVGLLALPLAYLVYYSYALRSDKMRREVSHMQEVNRLNQSIIRSLAMAIDAKDRHTGTHVDRVREYAVRLAERLGVSEEELEAVRIAALLHDIGKIGIPEQILCKQGKLTPEEFEMIKSHVDIGVTILEQVQFPWPVVPVVGSHHERWDGLGYPGGLKGEAIPIGGRIISLVDVYDALTSDRPYRRALAREDAVRILRAGSGTQFDPRVVETFIALLPETDAAIAALDAAQAAAPQLTPQVQAPAPSGPAPDDEVEAGLILSEMAEMARSAGFEELVPRVADRLGRLLPCSTFALYRTNAAGRALDCIYSGGLFTELFTDLEVRIGEGLSGYVAAMREPVVNAAAALDLARRIRPGENLELSSAVSVPLLAGGGVVGVLTVYHIGYNIFQPHHLARLERVARCVAETLSDAPRRPGASEQGAERHGGSALELLRTQITMADARDDSFAVVRMAITPPATADETEERRIYEKVQNKLNRLVRETIRERDFIVQPAAGEFMLVLPGCDGDDAERIEVRLRERLRLERLGGSLSRVQVSFRRGLYPRDGATARSLLAFVRDGEPDTLPCLRLAGYRSLPPLSGDP